MTIEQKRNDIKQIDEKLFSLLEQRMHIVKELLSIKEEQGVPIEDKEREVYLIELMAQHHPTLSKKEIAEIYEVLFRLSKKHKKRDAA